ncbi:hypothetical protein T01_3061, partial [Trichinella spiralis]
LLVNTNTSRCKKFFHIISYTYDNQDDALSIFTMIKVAPFFTLFFVLIQLSSTQYGGYLFNPLIARSYYMYSCPSGFARYNGVCVPNRFVQAKPGQFCNPLTECVGGSMCLGGICRCLPGLIPSGGVCVLPPFGMFG